MEILLQREHPAIQALLGRRSIRRFEERLVEEDTVALLLECACAAPSAANNRPWHFVVVTERAVVSADLAANSLCAGSPARVIRGGVTWTHANEP